MHTILFFDDWMIQNSRNLERKWFRAEPWPGHEPSFDRSLQVSYAFPTVHFDTGKKLWRMWAGGVQRISHECGADDGVHGVFLYESKDGLNWRPRVFDPPVDKRATEDLPHLVFSGNTAAIGFSVVLDPQAEDEDERYKMVYTDPLHGTPAGKRKEGRLATSPDGIHWTTHEDRLWNPNHVDAFHWTIYNPITQRFQWTSRSICGDRRIAMYSTQDWKNFEGPVVTIHPDPDDPPSVEFYGMSQTLYDGYFLGFLWRMNSAYAESGKANRLRGKVDSELIYSVNGTHWNRTNRGCPMPERGFGEACFRTEYPCCMVLDGEGWIRVYAVSMYHEHGDFDRDPETETLWYQTVSRFRRDGFCALETRTDSGHLTLRPMVSRGGRILLNATTGKYGCIRAELRTVPDNTPIPNFELENSVAVAGDGHFLQLKWKERETIAQFEDQPFRLHLEMDRARLYAVRLDADFAFAGYVHRNLAGEFDPVYHDWDFRPGRDSAYAGY